MIGTETGGVGSLAEGVGTDRMGAGDIGSLTEGVGTDGVGASGVGSLTEGVSTDGVGAEGVSADFVACCSLLSFSMASRASH